MIKQHLEKSLHTAIDSLVEGGVFNKEAVDALSAMAISRSKDRKFGDFALNIALILAKSQKKPPQEVARILQQELAKDQRTYEHVEIAGPGFLNVTLSDEVLSKVISHVATLGISYGKWPKNNKKALVEFVSANPTGGLHLGHARGAFMGDAVARVLEAAGYDVVREFYINDCGNQIETLARTIHKRYRELFGESITIEPGEYPGEYVIDIARALRDLHKDRWLYEPESVWLKPISQFGIDYNLSLIRRSLDRVDIHFDSWFSEQTLHTDGHLDRLLKVYHDRNMLYDAVVAEGVEGKVRREESKASKYAHLQEGGLFLRTKQYGDDEDRIVQRKDGRFVYLTADLAYHHEKYERGFDLIIDVLGGDHAGHMARIKAGMAALGHDPEKLKFVIVQIVRLLKGGSEVRFSKRSGQVVGLDDLIDEVGQDVARFVFLMRSANAQFDLDIDVVTKNSQDNPVYYVQYGHARMATLLNKACQEHGIEIDAQRFDAALQKLLILPEERELVLRVSELDEVVQEAANVLEPHKLIYFCHELIKIFHTYFTKYRSSEKMISSDKEKTEARLALVFAVKQSIFNALNILGISAPDYMEMPKRDDEGN